MGISPIQRIAAFFYCKHEYQFVRAIYEQNLRSGVKHRSAIYVCAKCGKQKTLEQL